MVFFQGNMKIINLHIEFCQCTLKLHLKLQVDELNLVNDVMFATSIDKQNKPLTLLCAKDFLLPFTQK